MNWFKLNVTSIKEIWSIPIALTVNLICHIHSKIARIQNTSARSSIIQCCRNSVCRSSRSRVCNKGFSTAHWSDWSVLHLFPQLRVSFDIVVAPSWQEKKNGKIVTMLHIVQCSILEWQETLSLCTAIKKPGTHTLQIKIIQTAKWFSNVKALLNLW